MISLGDTGPIGPLPWYITAVSPVALLGKAVQEDTHIRAYSLPGDRGRDSIGQQQRIRFRLQRVRPTAGGDCRDQ